jgi:uncharacterized protein YlxW (UPF0749 family)
MPGNERVDFDLTAQVAELRADVRHVQSDTTDIKAELRATNQRIDSLRESLASAKIWALGLYIALTGSLLYVMAHGFKWL